MNKLFLALMMVVAGASAQQTILTTASNETFKGILYDLQTGAHLEGASITLECDKNQLAAMTDMNGYFILQHLPKSCTRIRISMTGFEDKILENITVTKDVEYYIGLEQKRVPQPKILN